MDATNPPGGSRYIQATQAGAVRVVALSLPTVVPSDEFDNLNVALLAEMDAVGSGKCVLDLSGAAYMGSNMLGLMVNARQRVKAAGGRLVLCHLSPWLAQTFRTCSLEKLFTFADTRADALKAVVERK